VKNSSNIVYAEGNYGVYAFVQSLRYSLSYISYAFLQETGAKNFVTITKDGEPTYVTNSEAIIEAVGMVELNKLNSGSVIPYAAKVKGAWPIVDFSYIYLNTNYKSNRLLML